VMKSVRDETNVERERLVEYACALLSARRKIRLELGRTFLRIKATFPHGRWESFYEEKFGPSHVSLRTVQRWMRMARKADAKNDSMTFFEPATDPGAVKIRNATEQAKAEVDGVQRQEPRTVVYSVRLRVTSDQADRLGELRKSPKWPQIEAKIINFFDHLFIEYQLITDQSEPMGGSQK
jgi:hypothetical protein